jgi:hypothetical protein
MKLNVILFLARLLAPAAVDPSTFLTYDTVGDREDLTDIISNISPQKTPLYSMAGRGVATNTLHEWQTDSLAAPNTANAHLEGDDAEFTALTPTVRLGNYVQISRKTLIISDTQKKIKKAGRKNEVAYQAQKQSVELRRDIEAIMFENIGADAGSEAVERKTGTLLAFIKTNVDKEATGTNPVYTTVPTDPRNDGAQRAITEDMVKNVAQLGWTEGADFSTIFAGAFNKTKISAFTGIADKVFNLASAKQATIIGAADVYVSDFGTFKVVPSRWQRARDVFFVDPEYIEVMFLRGFELIPLARTGSAEKRLLEVEWGLRVKNEKALGLIADLLTS